MSKFFYLLWTIFCNRFYFRTVISLQERWAGSKEFPDAHCPSAQVSRLFTSRICVVHLLQLIDPILVHYYSLKLIIVIRFCSLCCTSRGFSHMQNVMCPPLQCYTGWFHCPWPSPVPAASSLMPFSWTEGNPGAACGLCNFAFLECGWSHALCSCFRLDPFISTV